MVVLTGFGYMASQSHALKSAADPAWNSEFNA